MKQGNIYYTDKDFTDLEVSITFKYPCMLILKNAENQIEKITTYNENGIKSVYDFSQSASKQFVTDSIATAIAGLQDNRLEYNEFSDFPAIGDETKFYIDITEDKIYIWDATSSTYKNQSWDTAIIASIQASISSLQNNKLDKGNYTGTAKNLKDEIDQKAFLKIFPSFADFPPPETLEYTEENKLYLDRFTGEIYLVWYERANPEDLGFNISYKKM